MNEPTSPNMYIKPDYSTQVAQWLAEGNQITQMTRAPVKLKAQFGDGKLKPKQRARLEEDQASRSDVVKLGRWLDGKKGRANLLAAKLGCRPERISQIKMFTRPCSKAKMTEIKQYIKEISAQEKQ